MRIISNFAAGIGIIIIVLSTWRYGMFYEDAFKLLVSYHLGAMWIVGGYLLNWMTEKDKHQNKIERRLDSLVQAWKSEKELRGVKRNESIKN